MHRIQRKPKAIPYNFNVVVKVNMQQKVTPLQLKKVKEWLKKELMVDDKAYETVEFPLTLSRDPQEFCISATAVEYFE